jgi:hypothetical protein
MSTGKNSFPLLSSRALPPCRSGTPAVPDTAKRKSWDSTGGLAVAVTRGGPLPRTKKRARITPPTAITPMIANVRTHHG